MALNTVNAKTLKTWLDNGDAVLVDVREPAEHAAQNIKGATLLPLSRISKSTLPPCTGKKLVIHCRKGGRGGTACEKLLAEDPNIEIYNLEGGLAAWVEAGLAIESSGSKILPLDQQVQLVIGILLITGSVVGYIFSPAWFLFTGCIGIGLSIAGLTGFCGLAYVMAKMPWNQCKQPTKSFCSLSQD